MSQDNIPREFTCGEFSAVKSLVTAMCANYDKKYDECVVLNGRCYMLGKQYTGSFCKYFKQAVLPLDPVLERQLEGVPERTPADGREGGTYRHCETCGLPFLPVVGNEKCCSLKCARARRIIKSREYKAARIRRRRKKFA